jgi:hypothetical protein
MAGFDTVDPAYACVPVVLPVARLARYRIMIMPNSLLKDIERRLD